MAKGKEIKRAHHKHEPAKAKEPRGEPPAEQEPTFLWSFARLDQGGPFCLSASDGGVLSVVLKKLGDFEGMSWVALREKNCHTVQIDSLSKEARDRLTELKLDDLDELYSLAFMNRQRMYAIRQKNVLRVLWWDPDHDKIYPVEKKHT